MSDYLRIYSVNGGVLAAVTILDIEAAFKILALALTCIWTALKIYGLCKGRKIED